MYVAELKKHTYYVWWIHAGLLNYFEELKTLVRMRLTSHGAIPHDWESQHTTRWADLRMRKSRYPTGW